MRHRVEPADHGAVFESSGGGRTVRRLSRAMAWACLVLGALLLGGMLYVWIASPAADLMRTTSDSAVTALGWPTRFWGFAVSMVPLGVLLFGLHSARQCFRSFAVGRIFTVETANHLRNFALAVGLSALLRPFAEAVVGLLLASPDGPRSLTLDVSSDTLLTLMFAGIFAVVAAILREAIAIADENRQFV